MFYLPSLTFGLSCQGCRFNPQHPVKVTTGVYPQFAHILDLTSEQKAGRFGMKSLTCPQE